MKGKMELKNVDTDKLVPNPFQPREGFEKESIRELADSLKTVGGIQPVIVRKHKKGFEIIAGERRWRAAKFAKLKKIPVLIRDTAEEDVLLESLIENLHRRDLTSVERENAIYDLWKTGKWKTKTELAKKLGKNERWVMENIGASMLRKEERIPAEISTKTILDTIGVEREERKQIIEKVRRKEIPEKEVREVVRAVKKVAEPVKRAILKPKSRITPKIAEIVSELPEEKQPEAIKEVERHRLDEYETKEIVEQLKEEAPTPPPETWEEIRETYKDLQEEIRERLKSPEVKSRGKLFRNWVAHTTLRGALDSAHCPICGADWRNLVWKCHGLNIKEALEKAKKDYQESIKKEKRK